MLLPPSERLQRYWRANLRYLAVLLSIWFIVSFGGGILFADALDRIRLGGFKLGFFFAQQGSIYVFVALIFVYVWLMNRLDRACDFDEKEAGEAGPYGVDPDDGGQGGGQP